MGEKAIKIVIDIGHPAHVHHFRNMIWDLQKRGHRIQIVAIDKDVTLSLLNAYGFNYVVLGQNKSSRLMPRANLVTKSTLALCKVANRFNPDMFISRGSPMIGLVSRLFHKPYICIFDSEHAKLEITLAKAFSDVICTPSCFKKDLGKKHIVFNGYKELAYLHPNYFKPDATVLGQLNLKPDEKFVILRFVAWDAHHDRGQFGLTLTTKRKLIEKIEQHARVFITSENPLPEEFEKYQVTIAPEKMHDLLYYASLCIGEGATMASECAVLGIPAIYVNTLSAGTLQEQEQKYGLIYCFHDMNSVQEQVIDKAIELLSKDDIKQQWQAKREKMLADKIDVTQFMVDFIEGWPESFDKYKR